MERSFSFVQVVYYDIVVRHCPLKSLLFMKWVNCTVFLIYFYGQQLGSESVDSPSTILSNSEFKRAKQKSFFIHTHDIFGPRQPCKMDKLYFTMCCFYYMINFGAFLPADIQIVVNARKEHRIDLSRLNLYFIKGTYCYSIDLL